MFVFSAFSKNLCKVFADRIFDAMSESERCALSFSKHLSLSKAKFFFPLKTLRCISASSWGSSRESLFLLHKVFLRQLFTYVSPGRFPFLSFTSDTKLKCFHQVASRAITGCLCGASSSPTSRPNSFLPVFV